MRVIAVKEGCAIIELDDGCVTWRAKGAVDTDGSGPSHGDPDYQPDTSLHLDGKPLNADVDKYIVVPPAIIHGVKGVVMGCKASVVNLRNGKATAAVVADQGPGLKIGELSCAAAIALGLDPSPTKGGEDEHVLDYKIWPGVPAEVDGKLYRLQPSGAA